MTDFQSTTGKRAGAAGIALALGLAALTGPASASLELRDINGTPVPAGSPRAVFAYDTVLDATWYLTSNNTGMSWDDAVEWTAALTIGTFRGWALPRTDPTCGDGQDYGFNCTRSQMGELWYVALGNKAGGPMTNTGPFRDLKPFFYWTGTSFGPDHHHYSWKFYTENGGQRAGWSRKAHKLYVLAIRPGDVAREVESGIHPAREAELLALLGGAVLVFAWRKSRPAA